MGNPPTPRTNKWAPPGHYQHATGVGGRGWGREARKPLRILSEPYLTHATLAELLKDLVVADRGSDHDAEIVPPTVAQGSKHSIESRNAISRH